MEKTSDNLSHETKLEREERKRENEYFRKCKEIECENVFLKEVLSNILTVIIPMAKGYAIEHQVGRNDKMVIEAENTIKIAVEIDMGKNSSEDKLEMYNGEYIKVGDKVLCSVREEHDREEHIGVVTEIENNIARVEFPSGYYQWTFLGRLKKV